MKETGKGREFEERLKLVAAPPPNPHARARAKDAALAEFERVQAAANETHVGIVPAPRASWIARLGAWLAGSGGWKPRATLLGGLASVFVAVFGVMSIWPMLAGRQVVPSIERPAAERALEDRASASAPLPAEEGYVARSGPAAESAGAPAQPAPAKLPEERDVLVSANVAGTRAPAAPASAPRPRGEVQRPAAPENERMLRKQAIDAVAAQVKAEADSEVEAKQLLETSSPEAIEALAVASREAAREKPDAGGIADSIQSEDIGDLPQTNVAESIRRRPAVNADRSFGYAETNPPRRTSDRTMSTFSVGVDTGSYRTLRSRIESGELPQKETVRVEELVNYFDYSWPQPETREQPFKPTIIVSDSPWGRGNKLVHIGIKGFQVDAQQRPDANVVVLVDVSGSMESRLADVKESLRLMLASLKPTDTVALVVYSRVTGVVLEATPVSERQKIWQAIEELKPATPAAPGTTGMKLAYDVAARHFRRDGTNRILLCTDGDFGAGMSESLTLRRLIQREREKGIFLSVLVYGAGEYRNAGEEEIARLGNGVAAFVGDAQQARRVLVEQATGTLFTIAEAVRFQVEFNPVTVAEWRLVGYEARELKGGGSGGNVNAGDVGSGHTATAIYEITPASAEAVAAASAKSGRAASDYGTLRIRYKLPGGFRSRSIEQPIGAGSTPIGDALRRDVEFSTAVAGFAQLLRGGRYTGGLTYEDVARQAEAARGADPLGYRAEFVQLVRRAQGADRAR